MPELPEVETLARQLAPLLRGRRLLRVRILDARLALEGAQRLRGRFVRDVARVGKEVVLWLGDGTVESEIGKHQSSIVNPQSAIRNSQSVIPGAPAGPLGLCIHLRMTGRLIWRAEGAANGNLDRPPRAKLTLEGGELWFMDVRRFGTMRLIDLGLESGGIGSVAPIDPLSRAYTPRALARLLAGSRGAIKPWLMRQDRLAGIGNIYASEALCEARISPLRAGGTLDANEVRHLHQALRAVLRRAIRNGGTTFSDFQDSRGEPGRNRRRLKVYDREGEPCRHCGSPIARIVQSSRSTFYCPDCQQ